MTASVLLSNAVDVLAQAEIRLSVVGRVELRADDGHVISLQPAQRQLLSLLAAAGPQGISTDRLADELWGERLPSRWQASLRMALSRLRKRFGEDRIAAEGGTVRLALDQAQVDLWKMLRDSPKLDEELLCQLLEAEQIFPGIEPSRTLTAVTRQIETLQRDLLLTLERGDEIPSRSVLTRAQGIAERDGLDRELIESVVRLHHRAGLRSSAREILDHASASWKESYGEALPDSLLSLRELLDEEPRQGRSSGAPTEAVDRTVTLPGSLEMFATHALFGRDRELAEAVSHLSLVRDGVTCGALLRGPSGAGKTHLGSAIARSLAGDGFNVLYAAAVPSAPAAYGPILACLPELAEIVQRVMSEPDDRLVRARRASIWAAALLALRDRADNRPLLLFIDDAQWLDSQSAMLVEFFLRSELPSGLAILVSARPESGRGADSLGGLTGLLAMAEFSLGSVDSGSLTALVRDVHPGLSGMALRRVVERLAEFSGGLPGIARIISSAIDEKGAFRSGQIDSNERRWSFDSLSALSPKANELGQVASVLGLEFSVDEVRMLSGMDEPSTIDALEELLAQEVLVETHQDRFRFVHILMAEAFRGALSEARQRRLHRDASRSAESPHQRARHLLNARPLVDDTNVIESVSASATQHLAEGSFAEAALQLNELREVRGELTIGESVTMSGVLSLAGSHEESDVVRQAAFERAAHNGRWRDAVAAALSGLPEAENPAGEPTRVRLLDLASTEDLPRDVAWELHLELARQAALAGQPELASRSSDIVLDLASSSAERALAVLAERGAKPNDPPGERLDRLSSVDDTDVPESVRSRVHQAKAIDLTELGRLAEAATEHDRFVELAHRTGDPLRVWHSLLFSAGEAFNQSDEAEFEDRRDAAHAHGLRHGIATAGAAYLAQAFLRMWWRREAAALEPFFPIDPSAPLLQRAGAVVVLAASGDREKAMRFAVELSELVPADYIALPCAALLAELVGASGDRAAIERLRTLLVPRIGSGILVGAGFASMGPADRYLGLLEQSRTEQERLIRDSCDLAASWGVTAWSDASVGRVLLD